MSNIDNIQIVRTRMVESNDSVKDVAADLGLTPGQTAFIKMQILVADGTVPAIKGRTEREIIAKVAKARKKADDYSSWGWLSARTGINEGQLKKAVDATKKVTVYTGRHETIVHDRIAKRSPKKAA
jgi:hypothetical protein